MQLTRRRLVTVMVSAPLLFAAGRGLRLAGDAAAGAIRAVRPPAQGTSATRCALCGAADHSMLDPRCPAARRVI
jgi:hypothetical protein